MLITFAQCLRQTALRVQTSLSALSAKRETRVLPRIDSRGLITRINLLREKRSDIPNESSVQCHSYNWFCVNFNVSSFGICSNTNTNADTRTRCYDCCSRRKPG